MGKLPSSLRGGAGRKASQTTSQEVGQSKYHLDENPKMPVDKSAPLGLGALFGQLDAVAIVANVGTPKK
ncbi:uncharacterized protein CLUP02_05652 [Colletotrichum lupini]|uniref:Uncharacterized protein n=1 Tax=Colletotrichum lupini TaxID=145971 RepID=A0A9Q8SNI9_9PEZI|nr:uncharacterized protein CLUP02_05652 [Colletotrichum lupini]UQC80170.1 hypothetical protein CLUP02_05652 [Colletotrichum lupini]